MIFIYDFQMANGCWWYFFSKFTEFFDTVFFVMRKRYDQVSTLHVIHHGLMPASVWWGVKFTPGGHSSFFGFLNTFVHIIMYTYYMLAAMGPQMQKYLWWKKYLTVIQMVQFVLVMVHAFQLLFKNDCNYPIYFAYFIGAHAVLFYFLFSNFYKRAYMKQEVISHYLISQSRKKLIGIYFQNNVCHETSINKKREGSVENFQPFNGKATNIYKNKIETTRSRHYVGSAN